MRTRLLLVLTLVGSSVSALAQDDRTPEVAVGDRVRVAREGDAVVGLVDAISADALVLTSDGAREHTTTLRLSEIESVAISRGRRSRGAGAWSKAKWGALLGAGSGAVLLGVQHEQVGDAGASAGKAAALGAWSGGLFGGLIGAMVGALHPGEQWEKASPTFQLRTGKDGFSFTTTIAF